MDCKTTPHYSSTFDEYADWCDTHQEWAGLCTKEGVESDEVNQWLHEIEGR